MFELFFFEIIFRNLKRTGKNKECVNSVLEFFSFICDADFLLYFDLFFAVLLNRVYEHEFSCKKPTKENGKTSCRKVLENFAAQRVIISLEESGSYAEPFEISCSRKH
jgi:hypothetical protein